MTSPSQAAADMREACAKVAEAMNDGLTTTHTKIAAAIRALPISPGGQEGWQPIETAPCDGTQFLALVSNGWYALASAPVEGLRENWPYQWWRTNDRCSYPVVDTHPAEYDWKQNSTLLLTHWQPLPSPPALTKDTDQ